MLVISILIFLLSIFLLIASIIMIRSFVIRSMAFPADELLIFLLDGFTMLWVVAIGLSLLSLPQLVLLYISLYDVYRSCDPYPAKKYLILSIIFPVCMPVFLFAGRKQDYGFHKSFPKIPSGAMEE